ncbi:MAG: O-antigen ligase family protein [Fibrobacteria bacterium]|nr:O-antigen ligase family protein [Fibrobacteria bacterium]
MGEQIAGKLDFETLLCSFAASIPWMPFVNLGQTPINAAYLMAILLWGAFVLRRGRALSIPLTPGLILGGAVFCWFAVGAMMTGSIRTALVDLLHFGNFLIAYALILASVRTKALLERMVKWMLVSSYAVAGFGVALSFLVNVLDMQFLPRIMVDVLGSILYGSRGQEMLIGYGLEMGNWYRDGQFRTVATFFNPMQNSEYTMFFLFLSVSQILVRSTLLSRRTLTLGTVVLALQLFVSFSRTAYFGAVAGGSGFFLLLLMLGVVPRRQVIRFALIAGVVMALFSPLAGAYAYETLLSIGDMRQFSNAGRLVAMSAGVLVWMHHPWFGTGFGNDFAMAFGNLDISQPNFLESLVMPYIREGLLYAKAVVFSELFEQTNYHSGHISLMAQLGLLGSALFWGWQFSWLRRAWLFATGSTDTFLKALGLGFVGGWGTFFVCLIIDDNLFYPKYMLSIFILAALCEVGVRIKREGRESISTGGK